MAGVWTRCHDHGIAPHAVSWGVALVLLPPVAALVSGTWQAPLAWCLTMLAYLSGYLRLKQWVFVGARRTLLVDLALFVAPTFVASCHALGLDAEAAVGVLAFVVPAGIVLLRTGCFFGGCCHGRACAFGVRYPQAPDRVLPLPLLEAVVGVGLLLAAVMLRAHLSPAQLAGGLLGAYAGYRFCAEFLRARRGPFAVRRFWGLSLTQWLCSGLLTGLFASLSN